MPMTFVKTSGTPVNFSGGGTCTCGAWVNYGELHRCGTPAPSFPVTFAPAVPNLDAQILAELHQIKLVLQKILDKP